MLFRSGINVIGDNTGPGTTKMTNQELLQSFQHPEKQFLDMSWLQSRTYNDNTTCGNKYMRGNGDGNKDMEVVPFGHKLSSCTNQDGSVSNQQLLDISNNTISPLDIAGH